MSKNARLKEANEVEACLEPGHDAVGATNESVGDARVSIGPQSQSTATMMTTRGKH